jgi:hypothetical protein
MLDGALARLATALGMAIDDHDTTGGHGGGDEGDASGRPTTGLVDVARRTSTGEVT